MRAPVEQDRRSIVEPRAVDFLGYVLRTGTFREVADWLVGLARIPRAGRVPRAPRALLHVLISASRSPL